MGAVMRPYKRKDFPKDRCTTEIHRTSRKAMHQELSRVRNQCRDGGDVGDWCEPVYGRYHDEWYWDWD